VAIKIRIPKKARLTRFFLTSKGKAFLLAFVLTVAAGIGTFTVYYQRWARITDEKLRAGPFANTSLLYAAPRPVSVGEEIQVKEIADYLRRTGYSEASNNRTGWFHIRPDAIEINPGPDAYDHEGGVIKVERGRVAQIISLRDQTERNEFLLEPELMTNLFDRSRAKRQIVHFNEIPQVMINAVLAAEDKHFFQHAGFDPIGIIRALWVDLRDRKASQGASTLSQQVARTLWLGPERGWRRKVAETMITLHMEQKLSKQQIFEYYANSIDVGHQGSFGIQGFAKGAEVYLGKDLNHISIAEAAFLAGMPQSPMGRNPFKYPDRAKARRDLVLKAMRDDGFINDQQYTEALATPFKVTRESAESSDAPFFVDLVNDTLQNQFQERDFQATSYRVYTTLDMNLQRDAVAAVRSMIEETDKQWRRRSKKYGTPEMPVAQVALVCLDAETGEVKALVGGRNYGTSQYDHAMSHRQPGSSFKPFVYATAFNSALTGATPLITPATLIMDEPTTFWFNDKPYEPADHSPKWQGQEVPAWFALSQSLNIPAVKVAEMVGYEKIVATARAAGMNEDIKPTPSIALGAYEVTPLEIATAYTVFVNHGDLIPSSFIKSIRTQNSDTIFQSKTERKHALDPRVAYLVENTMEEVLRSGTGAGVHSYGFNLPAAGKTGTSFDGWFAGFTSKLICVVWVGFDDNHDFKLEGAHSALPIWAEFMKNAHRHREYHNVHGFDAPDGIVAAEIDSETGELATSSCPKIRTQVFIAGSQPVDVCKLHGGGRTIVAGWEPTARPPEKIETLDSRRPVLAEAPPPAAKGQGGSRSIPITPAATPKPAPDKNEKKGFFGRIKDIFK
jgi:penicillin-binding protein 1B